MKAKEFIPASKPRNFVAKNQKTAGAGAHKDKKKAEKQGDVKHKGKQFDEDVTEGYGRYWCSTDKKWKTRKGPKQSRKTEDISERVRDPEDWDEGNTEPPNNFAVYINGKKWKVFRGRGQFADDYKEMQHYRQLQNWAQAKSQATGKKWEVYITGEPATESIEEDTEIPFNQCPRCQGPIFHESMMSEKQDACYHKVRSRYKVWPSAYASGALVQCRKKGAANWGNKGKK